MSDFTLPDDVFFEPDLKAYEGPVKFFLYNVNAANHAIGCKLDMIAITRSIRALQSASRKEMVEPDGVEPTTSCLQSRRSTN